MIAGLLALVTPLVFLVRAMRRQDRRARLANAPFTGLILLVAVSVAAWLWVSLADVRISASIHGPVQTFLGLASLVVYVLWLAVPVAAITWLVFKLPDLAARRPAVRGTLVAVGIAAAIAGVYFAFLTGGAIWDFVSLMRAISGQPSGGLAGPGVAIVALFSFIFVIVLGSVTGLLLLVAFWGLEPRRRWHTWRSPKSELPPG